MKASSFGRHEGLVVSPPSTFDPGDDPGMTPKTLRRILVEAEERARAIYGDTWVDWVRANPVEIPGSDPDDYQRFI